MQPYRPKKVTAFASFFLFIVIAAFDHSFCAEMNVQLTTNDGSTKISIQNAAASEVASIDSLGNAAFNRITQVGSGGSFVLNQATLQSGATFYVSSGTAVNFNTTNLTFADGTTLTTASGGGTITGVTAGTGLSGGGTSGNVTISLASNSTNYIQNTNLQTGATFYVSSGTVVNLNTTNLKFADGTTQTTAAGGGTITGVTAGYGLSGGGNSGIVTLNLVSNSTSYIQDSALQTGATFYVSSGTATNFNTSTLKFADGTTQTTASQGGTLTSVTAGVGLSGGGSSGGVTLNLVPDSTNYIQNANLQTGATFYVSSGTATNFNTTTLKFADGTSQTTAGTINGVTAVSGLSGGGTSGNVTISLASNSTNYIQNTNLQTGATFYVSSGTVSGQLSIGNLRIKEGSNAYMGTATLIAGTALVTTTSVTSNSRIFLTIQSLGGTLGTIYVSTIVSGTSFTITSTSALDTSVVAWLILNPS